MQKFVGMKECCPFQKCSKFNMDGGQVSCAKAMTVYRYTESALHHEGEGETTEESGEP